MRLSFKTWIEAVQPANFTMRSKLPNIGDLGVPKDNPDEHEYCLLPNEDWSKPADLPDLRSGDNPFGKLDCYIDNMMKSWSGFTPTRERLSPTMGGGINHMGVLVQTLVGKKPASWFQVKPTCLFAMLIKRIMQRIAQGDPLFPKKDIVMMRPWRDQKYNDLLIGDENAVRNLAPLIRKEREYIDAEVAAQRAAMEAGEEVKPTRVASIPLQRAIGQLLGYHPQGSEDYYRGQMTAPEDEGKYGNAMRQARLDKIASNTMPFDMAEPELKGKYKKGVVPQLS